MVYNIDMISCEQCKETGKRSYSTFYYEDKLITLCYECRYGVPVKKNLKTSESIFNSLQVPFWELMGQKPKPKDIAYQKYLKSRNMTYGDAVRERNYYYAKYPSALKEMQEQQKISPISYTKK